MKSRKAHMAAAKGVEVWRDRGALALDSTLRMAYRGPRTMLERERVAKWLDLGGTIPKAAIERLLQVSQS